MKRRTVLKAGLAVLAAPALAQGVRRIRFVPHANLAVLDPVASSAYVTRNHGFLVWDTLYGIDAEYRARPQMVAGHTVEDGGLRWTFTLREGLRFHDGEPVRAADCVASIRRWGARDTMGQTIMRIVDEIRATSDRDFAIRLKRPFPLMLDAFGKLSTQALFIVPERVGLSDPLVPSTESVGSGPFRFLRGEWVPGDRAVFERFEGYRPRAEPPDGAAGGKRVLVDRIVWRIIPDAATAAAALQTGEVDWYEQPAFDLLPILERNRDIVIETTDPLGSLMMIRFNHLHPPFNNPKIRQAVMVAVKQEDYLQAVVGNPKYMRECKSYFTCGTPLANDAGTAVMTGNLDQAKRMLAEAGYSNEKVVVTSPSDSPTIHAQGLVTADLLQRLGMNVEFVATDWGTVLSRRANRNPVGQGGWSIFHTWWVGPDLANPALHAPLRTHGGAAWPGWPEDATIEALRIRYLEARDLEEQKGVAVEIQKRAFEVVPYVTLGQMWLPMAFRRYVQDIVAAPIPFFWGVKRAA